MASLVTVAPPTTWLAAGALGRLGEALAVLPDAPIVLVTGRSSYELSGARATVESQLAGRRVEHFTGFSPNPTVQEVEAGLTIVRELSKDELPVIIGVGGGSPMDMAKLLAAAATQEHSLAEVLGQGLALKPALATLILVPTTAGTGSEATHFATVYNGTQKYSVADPSLRPRWAIIDPDLSASLPAAITASTGVDALCQGIESLWAVRSTEASRQDARRAITLAMEHLEAAVLAPTAEARLGMCEAAHLAGKAIDVSKTTACHALSYGLTIRWGVPHGQAVGTSLGEMIVFNAEVDSDNVIDPRGVDHVRGVMAEVIALLGGSDAHEARDRFAQLMERLGLESKHGALGAGAPDDRAWLAASVNLERLGNNPRRMSAEDLDGVLCRIAE